MGDGDREQRLRDLFDRALPMPPAERERLVAGIDDELLAERLRALLAQDARGTASVLQGTPAAAIAALRRVGNYELLRELGSGGMGTVMLARQVDPVERLVALKMVHGDDASTGVVERFEQERQTLALMNHPGIARMYEGGTTDDGTHWFAMEYVHGEPITAYCDRRELGCAERIALLEGVCDAVQHAHQKAVLHRDLKPGNVLVSEEGGRPHPKVIDFGVARALSRAPGQRLLPDEAGKVVGTWVYMSPEQADPASQDVDTRSDIYSLGVLLYELLAGELPLAAGDGTGFEEFRTALQQQAPPPPSTRLQALPAERQLLHARRRGASAPQLVRRLRGDLDAIVGRALAKDRNGRYATASELRADLDRHLRSEPVTALPATVRYRFGRFVRRNRVLVGASALVVLGLAGTVVGAIWGMLGAEAAREAEAESHGRDLRELADIAARAGFFDQVLFYADPGLGGAGLRDVLDRLAPAIGRCYAGRPFEAAAVHAGVGRLYLGAGEPKKAEPHLLRAWELTRSPDQPADPLRDFRLLADLARAARKVHGPAAAREHQIAMLKLGVRTLQGPAPQLARSLEELARLAQDPDARTTFLQRLDAVIELATRQSADGSGGMVQFVGPMLASLGQLLLDEGFEAGSLVLQRLEAEIRKLYDGLELLLPLARLAESLLQLRSFDDARRLATEVLATLDGLSVGDHWLRLKCRRIRGLALVMLGQERSGEAELVALQEQLGSLDPGANEEARAAAACLRELCERLAVAGRLGSFCSDSSVRWREAAAATPAPWPPAWWLATAEGLPAAALTAASGALQALPEADHAPATRGALGGILLRMDRTEAALAELEAARAGFAAPPPELLADLVQACRGVGRAGDAGVALEALEAAARTTPAARVERALARTRAHLRR